MHDSSLSFLLKGMQFKTRHRRTKANRQIRKAPSQQNKHISSAQQGVRHKHAFFNVMPLQQLSFFLETMYQKELFVYRKSLNNVMMMSFILSRDKAKSFYIYNNLVTKYFELYIYIYI